MTVATPPGSADRHLESWLDTLKRARQDVSRAPISVQSGRLTRAVGLVLEAVGLQLPVGSDCLVELPLGRGAQEG